MVDPHQSAGKSASRSRSTRPPRPVSEHNHLGSTMGSERPCSIASSSRAGDDPTCTIPKAWEQAGHPHDFYVAHRRARPSDARWKKEPFYDSRQLRRHERVLSQLEKDRIAKIIEERKKKVEAQRVQAMQLRNQFRVRAAKCTQNATKQKSLHPRPRSVTPFFNRVDFEKENNLPPKERRNSIGGLTPAQLSKLPQLANTPAAPAAPSATPARSKSAAPAVREVRKENFAREMVELDDFENRLH